DPLPLALAPPERPERVSGSGAQSPGRDRPATPMSARPDLAALRQIHEREQKFWSDLAAILDVRRTLGAREYRETVASLTTDYLGLTPAAAAAFTETAAAAASDIRQ